MYYVCLRAKGIAVGGMRVVFFQRSCHGSGGVAGCWGMLAALGSAEPAGCHRPADGGTWGTAPATVAAWLGEGSFGVTLGQRATQEPEARNSL